MRERAALYQLKRGEPLSYDASNELTPRAKGESWASIRQRVRECVLSNWDLEWGMNCKGCPFHSFDIGKRMGIEWFHPDKTVTWFIIEYDPFGAYFQRFGITINEGVCVCGDKNSPRVISNTSAPSKAKSGICIYRDWMSWVGSMV